MALDLAQWRVFLAAADCGSLIKAAEVLHTDQPALSRSLRRLEVLIGAPLFLRSSRGLTLTELGRRMLEPVRELVTHADTIETQVRAEARQTSGSLRVGAVDVYPLSAAIAEACRDLTVAGQPVMTEVIGLPWLAHPRALLNRTIDVGCTLTVDGRLRDAQTMRSLPLWEEHEAFALISAHHPLAHAEVVDPRDLADLPLHLPDKSDNPDIYNLILEQLAEAGVPAPRRASPVETFASVIGNVSSGSGWLFSARTLSRTTPPGTVAKPLAVPALHSVKFEIIWHVNSDRPGSPRSSSASRAHSPTTPDLLASGSPGGRGMPRALCRRVGGRAVGAHAVWAPTGSRPADQCIAVVSHSMTGGIS